VVEIPRQSAAQQSVRKQTKRSSDAITGRCRVCRSPPIFLEIQSPSCAPSLPCASFASPRGTFHEPRTGVFGEVDRTACEALLKLPYYDKRCTMFIRTSPNVPDSKLCVSVRTTEGTIVHQLVDRKLTITEIQSAIEDKYHQQPECHFWPKLVFAFDDQARFTAVERAFAKLVEKLQPHGQLVIDKSNRQILSGYGKADLRALAALVPELNTFELFGRYGLLTGIYCRDGEHARRTEPLGLRMRCS